MHLLLPRHSFSAPLTTTHWQGRNSTDTFRTAFSKPISTFRLVPAPRRRAALMTDQLMQKASFASATMPDSTVELQSTSVLPSGIEGNTADVTMPASPSPATPVKRPRQKRPRKAIIAAAAQQEVATHLGTAAPPATALPDVKLEATEPPSTPVAISRHRQEPVTPATSLDTASTAAAVKQEAQAPAPAKPKRSRKKPVAAAATADAPVSSTAEQAKPAPQARKRAPRKPTAKAQAAQSSAEALDQADAQAQPVPASAQVAAPPKPKWSRKKAAAPAAAVAVKQEDLALPEASAEPAPAAKPKRVRKKPAAAVKAEEAAAQPDADTEADVVAPPKKRARRKATAVKVEPAEGEAQDAEGQADAVKAPKRRRRGLTENPFVIPGREMLETAATLTIPPRPVPNLGYACLNMDLREQKPPVFTNRDCIKKSFTEKGLPFISQLALENAKALAGLIQWNHEHNIRLFRMTSNVFPWCTEYDLEQLPDFAAISEELAFAGKLARAYDQRLTFHPSHFVKLAAAEPNLLARSIKELEVHSQMMDLMGYEKASPENKINIHVGGVYGDKEGTLERFAVGYRKLSPRLQARLTVENDDLANSFSVADLMKLHEKIRMPIVFDFHHYKFCKGDQTADKALADALSTWPEGIRPVVHWSESQVGRPGHAHSDYIYGPMDLLGREKDVDVMIEAKCKERALRAFRGDAEVLLPAKLTQEDLDKAAAEIPPSAAFQFA